jgi:hypothetical protein
MEHPTASAALLAFGVEPGSRNSAREAINLETARQYLAAIEASIAGDSIVASPAASTFFDPGVVQEEFPNRFVPTGARRDLAALIQAAERGRAVRRGQRYHVRAANAVGDTVILEVLWARISRIERIESSDRQQACAWLNSSH